MDESAIDAKGLRKAFGDHVVLDGIDLEVPRGSVYALLGPNGAGKTTAVKILTTLIAADAGSVRVAGHDLATDPQGVRSVIGVTGQFSAVDDLLTGAENLRLMADLGHLGREAGRRRVADLLELFELGDAADRSAATYSGGMRRRLDLAMTLVGRPEVIFLDEPTTSLDPRSRRDVWEMVSRLVGDGAGLLLTTQYLEEADALADRIGVLDDGRLVAEGTAEELKRTVPGGHVRLELATADDLARAEGALGVTGSGDERSLDVPDDGTVASLRSLLDRLDAASVEVASLAIRTPDLDDVFLALTGQAPAAKQADQPLEKDEVTA